MNCKFHKNHRLLQLWFWLPPAKQINALARCKLLTDETEMVPGEVVEGYEHDEFYVDDEKLYEIIMKLFYKPVD